MDIQSTIRQFIQKGKIDQAIQTGINWAQTHNREETLHQLTLLQARRIRSKNQESLGLLTSAEGMKEQLVIANSLLEFVAGWSIPETTTSPLPPPQPHKILFLASNPSDTARLQLETEFARISRLVQDSSPPIQLVSEWAVTVDDLQKAILQHRPSIIHFSGHGTDGKTEPTSTGRSLAIKKGNSGGILLRDHQGKSKLAPAKGLDELLSIMVSRFHIEAVILNACLSADQARAISQHVPFVVGMQQSVHDSAAIAFSEGFYLGLATENDIELAFLLAKNKILLGGMGDHDIPVMYRKDTV